MENNEILKLRRKLKSLQKKLGKLGPVMRGSVVLLGPKNKYPPPEEVVLSLPL